MNVEIFKNPFISWLPTRNLFLEEECGDFCNFFLKIWQNQDHEGENRKMLEMFK